jgi:hypothetical protein
VYLLHRSLFSLRTRARRHPPEQLGTVRVSTAVVSDRVYGRLGLRPRGQFRPAESARGAGAHRRAAVPPRVRRRGRRYGSGSAWLPP